MEDNPSLALSDDCWPLSRPRSEMKMSPTSDLNAGRDQLVRILERDLIGPRGGADEVIPDRPSDRYITGALYPPQPVDPDERLNDEDDADVATAETGGPGDAI